MTADPNDQDRSDQPLILLTGAAGLVGTRLVSAIPPDQLCAHYHHAPQNPAGAYHFVGDVSDPAHVYWLAGRITPTTIIHAAAFVDVDRCETEPALSEKGNVLAVQLLLAAFPGAKFVQISTDYVFSDDPARRPNPPRPNDPPHPPNIYGRHKLAAEEVVRQKSSCNLIVRINSVFDHIGRSNIFSMICDRLSAGKEITAPRDQMANPIAAFAVAEMTMRLLAAGATGVYHLGGKDYVSRYEFACRIAEYFGFEKKQITPCSAGDQSRPAKRPHYGGLDCRETELFLGQAMPTLTEQFARIREEQQAGTD
jgi:dTDP-4-dehydrorhamnose reductase